MKKIGDIIVVLASEALGTPASKATVVRVICERPGEETYEVVCLDDGEIIEVNEEGEPLLMY